MFGNEYKKQCETLRAQLIESQKLLEAASQNNDKLYIVKMVVDNPDQFMLDGEYVMDSSTATYGGRPVSFCGHISDRGC